MEKNKPYTINNNLKKQKWLYHISKSNIHSKGSEAGYPPGGSFEICGNSCSEGNSKRLTNTKRQVGRWLRGGDSMKQLRDSSRILRPTSISEQLRTKFGVHDITFQSSQILNLKRYK